MTMQNYNTYYLFIICVLTVICMIGVIVYFAKPDFRTQKMQALYRCANFRELPIVGEEGLIYYLDETRVHLTYTTGIGYRLMESFKRPTGLREVIYFKSKETLKVTIDFFNGESFSFVQTIESKGPKFNYNRFLSLILSTQEYYTVLVSDQEFQIPLKQVKDFRMEVIVPS